MQCCVGAAMTCVHRRKIWDRAREEAFQRGWRRPWDGLNGRDYLKWKRTKERKLRADKELERMLAKVHDSDAESDDSAESINSQSSAVQEKRRMEHLEAIKASLQDNAASYDFASESDKSAEADSSDGSEDV